jgi:hypothetical protein
MFLLVCDGKVAVTYAQKCTVWLQKGLFVAVAVFKSAMRFLVGKLVLLFCGSEGGGVFLEVSLREKDASTVGAFVVVVAIRLSHVFAFT